MNNKHASNEQIKKEWAAQASAKEIADATKGGLGHNSETFDKADEQVQNYFKNLLKLKEDVKAINADIRHIITSMKEKYGWPAEAIRAHLSDLTKDQARVAAREQSLVEIRIANGVDLFNWNGEEKVVEADIDSDAKPNPEEAAMKEAAPAKVKAVK